MKKTLSWGKDQFHKIHSFILLKKKVVVYFFFSLLKKETQNVLFWYAISEDLMATSTSIRHVEQVAKC